MTTAGWSQVRTDEILVPVIRDINRAEKEFNRLRQEARAGHESGAVQDPVEELPTSSQRDKRGTRQKDTEGGSKKRNSGNQRVHPITNYTIRP
ncbi:hypothetical protein NUU61_006213 [Penicillium alfredii]|uniref:Uncharacterized protein n=1 Tax=Penicillium alfredii TaxID=1506179 RepID=A0A9W9F0E4_9EURO|nr:uncharacterized protein NUU61_006213 [Penicillium alfredii]KAJ5091343.1 hypothetical protein NUU61_006213 [Penicillium alfredii]